MSKNKYKVFEEDFVVTSKKHFIDLLNKQQPGWEFIGDNPFSEYNMQNFRICEALSKLAVFLFDDDDIERLEEIWDDLPDEDSDYPTDSIDTLAWIKDNICRECGGKSKDSKALINFHNLQTSGSNEFETKFVTTNKCIKCGHSWGIKNESTDTVSRKKAMNWWGNLTDTEKYKLDRDTHYLRPGRGISWQNFTGREIEMIYKDSSSNKQPTINRNLITILRACYKDKIKEVSFPLGTFSEIESLIEEPNPDSILITFWRDKLYPLSGCDTWEPVWKNWYASI